MIQDNYPYEEPVDLLTLLADVGGQAICAHPDYDEDKHRIIIAIDSDKRGGLSMIGYDEENWKEAVFNLYQQMRAIVRTHGGDMEIIGIPDDIGDLT